MEEVAGVPMLLLGADLGAVKKEVMLAFAFGFFTAAAVEARSAALRLSGVVISAILGGTFDLKERLNSGWMIR